MDVYLTCLVAMDIKISKTNVKEEQSVEASEECWKEKIDNEIKLPVLMNLSACTLKLGMHRKTCSFCNMAIEIKAGSVNPKVYFRRGRSNMLLGLYKNARNDFNTCLKLLNDSNDECDSCKNEIDAVNRELRNLDNLIIAAEKNRKRHEKAMKIVLGGETSFREMQESSKSEEANVNNDDVNDEDLDKGLYSDIHSSKSSKREYSTLRARARKRKPQIENNLTTLERPITYVMWYAQMLERGLRRILYWLGDEEAMSRSFEEEEGGTNMSMNSQHQRSSKIKQL